MNYSFKIKQGEFDSRIVCIPAFADITLDGEEKTAEKKDELKNDSLDTNLFVSKNAEIPATKNEKLQKGNKISANDFSKIQELGEVVSQNQNANEISESIDFKNADTILKNDKKIKELAGENLENSDFVFAKNSEEVSNLSLGEKSFDNSNFNFKNQNQNNSKNEDVTKQFNDGALISLKKLQEENVNVLILKERSPSCGYKKIYDGTFSKTIIDGNGVFASLALKNGFTIYTESDIENIIKKNG